MRILKIMGLLVISVAISCGEKTKRDSSPSQTQPNQINSDDAVGNSEAVTGGGVKATSTAAECNAKGMAFAAIVQPGDDPSGCSGQIAEFGCCQETAALLFKDQSLSQDFSRRVGQQVSNGLTLYNCEQQGETGIRFHFAKVTGPGALQYASVDGAGARKGATSNVSCPKIPDTSFLDQLSAGNSSSDGDSGSSAQKITFAAVKPLLEKNCGSCHESASTFVGDETKFNAGKAEVKNRLLLGEADPKRMPQINEKNPTDIDEIERQAIILFIDRFSGD